MEVEEINSPKQPATKYSRISSNGGGLSVDGGGRWGRQWGDSSSRIIRVSRASGGKDRHSKVWTAKGPRDRRVRLSVTTAIQFYDLQDRLGLDQPSKAVEWLINQASDAINDLPCLDVAGFYPNKDVGPDNGPANGLGSLSRSGGGSSSNNSEETSKGTGLSLSRSEIRVKARERARERTAKETEHPQQQQQQQQQNSSFTQLLTAGIDTHDTAVVSSAPEYFGNGLMMGVSATRSFNGATHEIQHQQHHNQNHSQQHFPFLIDQHQHQHRLGQTATESGGFNRGTLQSNYSSSTPSMLSYLQRFSDGSSLPFFLGGAPISPVVDNQQHHHHHDHHHQFNPPGLHLCYGDHKGKGKN